MYTRNFGKQKYTPPPGYDGTAFNETVATKHHEPTELIRESAKEKESYPESMLQPQKEERIIQNIPEKSAPISTEPVVYQKKEDQFSQILHALRGKLGTEELIILLVMLLIASEGFSTEMLVLGILLVI